MVIFQWDSLSNVTGQPNNFGGSRMYGNNVNSGANMQSQNQRWQTPGPIQRPSNSNGCISGSTSSPYVNYQQNYQTSQYQQRQIRNSMNPSINNNSGMSMMPQGKSQYFNPPQPGTKRKTQS